MKWLNVMWLKRMLKDRQELFVLGELALFLAAWGLGLAAAVDDHRDRTNARAQNNVAVNSKYDGSKYDGSKYDGSKYDEPKYEGSSHFNSRFSSGDFSK